MFSIFASRIILDVDHLESEPVSSRIKHGVIAAVHELLDLTLLSTLVGTNSLLRTRIMRSQGLHSLIDGIDRLVALGLLRLEGLELPVDNIYDRLDDFIFPESLFEDIIESLFS